MLESLLRDIRDRSHRFIVYGSDEDPDVAEWFHARSVDVNFRSLPANGSDPFLVVERDGEFVGAIGIDALGNLFEPPVVRPGETDGIAEGYRVLFAVLDDLVFSAMTRRELLAVSREIEDRAFRVGSGTLRVGFQTLSTFRSQTDVYRRLAAETALDIHVYGAGDWTPPAIAGITYHRDTDDLLGRYWVLAFDGGSDGIHPCGLVAKEQPDGYDGFWTDDAAVVTAIEAALTSV